MTAYRFLVPFLVVSQILVAQEFRLNENGLIYDDATMNELRFQADNREANFRACPAQAAFRAPTQAQVHFVAFSGPKAVLAEIGQTLRAGIGYERALQRFGSWVDFRFEQAPAIWDTSYDGSKKRLWIYHPHAEREDLSDALTLTSEVPVGTWRLFDHNTGKSLIEAVYFASALTSPALPREYAEMVQYARCQIDPHQSLFSEPEEPAEGSALTAVTVFSALLTPAPHPKYPENGDDETAVKAWREACRAWDQAKKSHEEKVAATHPGYLQLLLAAEEEALRYGNCTFELIEHVQTRFGPERALALHRRNQLHGLCSRDLAPRIQGRQMAQLAAASGNWDAFIRAHLNLLNDRFVRTSDGSWAQSRRQTYLAELESLDIDTTALLLGTAFLVDADEPTAYRANLTRLGRAFAETRDPDGFEARIVHILDDARLDPVNRLRILMLYIGYLQHLDRPEEAEYLRQDLVSRAEEWGSYFKLMVDQWLDG